MDKREADLEVRGAKVEAKEREVNKIPELEERAHLLESKVHLLNSEVDSLTKERDELEETVRSKKEVLEEIKDFKERGEEAKNQLSELSNRVDLQRRSVKKLDETQKQIEMESLSLLRIKDELDKNRKINMRLVDDNFRLEEETRVKMEAIKEIKQSYYGYIELTKQIALYMEGGLETKTKTHEEIREKVLRGMKIIAEKAKIAEPDPESDLQALLRDLSTLKKILL